MKPYYEHVTIYHGDELFFYVGDYDAACSLVTEFHYSERVPSNVQMVGTWHEAGGLFGNRGRAVAAIFFTIPPTQWTEEVWELNRLVRREDVIVPLTGLISLSCRHMKRRNMQDLLVSFADPTHGHHGGIYQAASWHFHDKRERSMDGVLIDGIFKPGRSCNSVYGTRSPEKLREILGSDHTIEPHFDDGKYLYWRPLTRNGEAKAKRLKLVKSAYPKPDIPAKSEIGA